MDRSNAAGAAPAHDSVAERLVFREMIRATAHDAERGASELCDANHQRRYAELPALLDGIQEFLAAHQVQDGDCITVELANNAPGALTMLALLDGGYSVVSTPAKGLGVRSGPSDIPPPRFSRWILNTVAADAEAVDLAKPASWLSLRANELNKSDAPAPSVDSPRLFVRTSGSLSGGKLAAHTFPRFLGNVRAAAARFHLAPTDRIALPVPIYHMFGLGAVLLPTVAAGASIDVQERANLLRFLEREADFNPNVLFTAPSFCESILRTRRRPRPYRAIFIGGDRTGESTRSRSETLHGPLYEVYGSTELGVIAAAERGVANTPESRAAVKPLPGVTFRLIPVEADDKGQEGLADLLLRSDYQFERYVDPEGTTMQAPTAFDAGWYCTRDLAKPVEDGALLIVGRSDLSLNRNGLLLPFADVEVRLREIEGVEEAAVAAGPDTIRGRALVAFCVMRQGTEMSHGDLRARYAERAPVFSVPDSLHIVAALPKLPNGKIDRRTLASMAEASA